MFFVVTALGVWLGSEMNHIRKRQEFMRWIKQDAHRGEVMAAAEFPVPEQIPIWRRWLGDRTVHILVLENMSPTDVRTAMRLFPEAKLATYDLGILNPELIEIILRGTASEQNGGEGNPAQRDPM